MNAHVGRVLQYDPRRHEARVRLGGVACRVCGGRGCALKDRVVTVAIPRDRSVAAGDRVRIVGDGRAMVRAALRLIVAPAGVALGVYGGIAVLIPVLSGSHLDLSEPARYAALAGALIVLGATYLRGSRRGDLPVLVETLAPTEPDDTVGANTRLEEPASNDRW